MGRRKLEIKRIEDKSSRLVTFSKRRVGLIKKSRQLSVLCDVDVAVVIFSACGKLYEFCSGGTNSVEHIISRYQRSCLEQEKRTFKGDDNHLKFSCSTKFQTCKELLQNVDRLFGETKTEEVSVTAMTQLEEELHVALMQTRLRKTQLMMEYISTLHKQERKLSEENQEIEKQVASAKQNGGGDLKDLATNHMNSPQLVTLPLFNA